MGYAREEGGAADGGGEAQLLLLVERLDPADAVQLGQKRMEGLI